MMRTAAVQKLSIGVIAQQLFHLFYYPFVGTDAGFYLSVARELYQGKVYFIEIASSYNPLSIAYIGLPFLFSDQPDPRFFLAMNVVILVGCACLLRQIFEHISPKNASNGFLAILFFCSSLYLSGIDITLEPLSLFFQLLALWAYLRFKSNRSLAYLFLTGFCLSLAFLAKQYGYFLLFSWTSLEQVCTSLRAGAFQHRGSDGFGRLRSSGVQLTTNLELVRTRG
uniref:ArnT family glycosyltransferase n=1 Tax=Pedobacter sp. TaxID=1411316 RepID=UPI003D7F1BB5